MQIYFLGKYNNKKKKKMTIYVAYDSLKIENKTLYH